MAISVLKTHLPPGVNDLNQRTYDIQKTNWTPSKLLMYGNFTPC